MLLSAGEGFGESLNQNREGHCQTTFSAVPWAVVTSQVLQRGQREHAPMWLLLWVEEPPQSIFEDERMSAILYEQCLQGIWCKITRLTEREHGDLDTCQSAGASEGPILHGPLIV